MAASPYLLISLPAAVLMVFLHTFSAYFPRSGLQEYPWLLSLFSGISVAYIFVHLIPDIVHYAILTNNVQLITIAFGRQLIFLMALLGFSLFYVSEHVALRSRRKNREALFHQLWLHHLGHHHVWPWEPHQVHVLCTQTRFPYFHLEPVQIPADQEAEVHAASERLRDTVVDEHFGDISSIRSFWLHMGFFGIYNVIVGYLIPAKQLNFGIGETYLFTVAIGLHMLVNDVSLAIHHRKRYTMFGRWLLASGILVGYVVGFFWEIPAYGLALMNSFVGGSTILNTMKNELPESKSGNIVAFLVGAASYALLLVFLK